MAITSTTGERIVRLSFSWLAGGAGAILLLGLAGGLLGQYFFPETTRVIRNEGDVITTVQEVTISPSQASAEVVKGNQEAVFLIGTVTEQIPPATLAVGLLMTNDGILVTTGTLPATPLQAYDYTGASIEAEVVGYDPLFDISYLQLKTGVFSPVDFAQADPLVGTQLLLLGLAPTTFQPEVRPFTLRAYELANDTFFGVPRLMLAAEEIGEATRGMPLFNDEGRVAGILRSSERGEAIPIQRLEKSLARFTGKNLEVNSVEALGLTIAYEFRRLEENGSVSLVAQVERVVPNSPAQQAGLKVGDIVTRVEQVALNWEQGLPELINPGQAQNWNIRRGEVDVNLLLRL
jgi:S1-C subfamily serine protease